MVRGKVLPAQTPAPIVIDTSIHNRFDFEVVDAKTKKVKQRAQAFNVVCEGLWTALGKSFNSSSYYEGWFHSIAYGTGSGTPSETDTKLFNQIGKMQGLHVTWGRSYKDSHVWIRKDISITELMNVGETISEIGIVDSAGLLCTHAMLQDMNGNQISIHKTDTDIINVYATVFIHFPAELLDVNSPVQVALKGAGSSSSFIRVLMGWHDYYWNTYYNTYTHFTPSKGRHLPHGSASNETINKIIPTPETFDVSTRTLTISGRSAAVNNNIPGGFSWLIMHAPGDSTYVGYSSTSLMLKAIPPVFSGSKILGEAIGTGDGETVDFVTKFDLPKNAKIYVDGVLQSDVVVDCVPLSHNKMGKYLCIIDVEDGVAYSAVNFFSSGGAFNSLFESSDAVGEVNASVTTFYNPFFEYGLKSFSFNIYDTRDDGGMFISDDLVNWIKVSKYNGLGARETYNVPEEYQHYKYLRMIDKSGSINCDNYLYNLVSVSLTGKNIHFATPPAVGAVITADYDTEVIAKDSNHVFDLNVVMQFNQYNEV